MQKKVYLITIIFTLLIGFTIAQENRNKISFNRDWKFKLDSTQHYNEQITNDANWRKINLPHDWSIEGSFDEHNPATVGGGALPGGIGWYRKTFTVSTSDKNKMVLIDFDGVYKNSEVWINGHYLGMRPNGYISFQYDLTPYLFYGTQKNTIAVKADNSKQPNSRWYSGSGIYRNVWLTTVNKIHVANWGTFITTPTVNNKLATVNFSVSIKNNFSADKSVIVKTLVFEGTNKQITTSKATTSIKCSVTSNNTISQTIHIANPVLWSVEKPSLYTAVTQIFLQGKMIDSYQTTFGIRYFKFDVDKGFSLNGKALKIMGVCNHHDLGALGAAVNKRALQRQLQILKSMGCNGIRTSHNPPAPELLDLCDEMGFIVMDEAFDMWAKQKNKYDYHLDWNKWHKTDLEDQILRDRNHPSVFIWSVGNEIPEQGGNASKGDTSGRVIARELVSIVKSLDTTRQITTANNDVNKNNNIILSGAFDLIGYNYNHNDWQNFRKRWPGKKMIVTESTSALETRGTYELFPVDSIRRWPKRWDIPFENPKGGYTVSAYDNISTPWGSTHEESIKALLKSEEVAGMYIWTGFDYLGEPTPYTWPARSSYFGIIDLAGFPKDVYYLYQSIFTTKPVLHIYPHWNWKQGDTVDIVSYYNNADEVELFLNGKSLGVKSKTKDDLHISWRVPYAPGALKAVSKKEGKIVLSTEIKTAGVAAKIILKADRSILKADGSDLCFVTVTIVDKDGIMVPTANNLIHFKVDGTGFINSVDSGDPLSHEPFKASQHTALNGLALAIIQSNGKQGKVVITAGSEGLKDAKILILTK